MKTLAPEVFDHALLILRDVARTEEADGQLRHRLISAVRDLVQDCEQHQDGLNAMVKADIRRILRDLEDGGY